MKNSEVGELWIYEHMGVSKNRGTPKRMVYNGKPYQNGWFGGIPIFGNTPFRLDKYAVSRYPVLHRQTEVGKRSWWTLHDSWGRREAQEPWLTFLKLNFGEVRVQFPISSLQPHENLFVSSSESWNLEKIQEQLKILWRSSPFTTGGDFSKRSTPLQSIFFVSPRSQTSSFIPSCRLTHLSFISLDLTSLGISRCWTSASTSPAYPGVKFFWSFRYRNFLRVGS